MRGASHYMKTQTAVEGVRAFVSSPVKYTLRKETEPRIDVTPETRQSRLEKGGFGGR
jgi:hypothetical protein